MMNAFKETLPGKAMLRHFELGTPLLFFGMLAQDPSLLWAGKNALTELASSGFSVPTSQSRVQVHALESLPPFQERGAHAGLWQPGLIFIRHAQNDKESAKMALRHELMHEASYRTCFGKIPQWAEEAHALIFSGEIERMKEHSRELPTEREREVLAKRLHNDGRLGASELQTFKTLLAQRDAPLKPCEVPDLFPLEKSKEMFRKGEISYRLIHLFSGRVLEFHGDQLTNAPLGSLLKLPFAASLQTLTPGEKEKVGRALLESDGQILKSFEACLDASLHQRMLGSAWDEKKDLLGGRSRAAEDFVEMGLEEASLIMRTSLLAGDKKIWGALRGNGRIKNSTLNKISASSKQALFGLNAVAKTGTVGNSAHLPLFGHLLLAWPAEKPLYLAVVRQQGVNGFKVAENATELMKRWKKRYGDKDFPATRVELYARLAAPMWQLNSVCETFGVAWMTNTQASKCTRFESVRLAQKKLQPQKRILQGLVEKGTSGSFLLTDPETFSDGVLAAEASELKGAAREALRAIIFWNATRGQNRHHKKDALCDTTHCMVYQGTPKSSEEVTNPSLLKALDEMHRSGPRDEAWLSFSKGGDAPWTQTLSAKRVSLVLQEHVVLDLRRERTRGGDVLISLVSSEHEKKISCEFLRNSLKLLSCPSTIRYDNKLDAWHFTGRGEGHGSGFQFERAVRLSEEGMSALDILKDAYETGQAGRAKTKGQL